MNDQELTNEIKGKFKEGTIKKKVFDLLSDQKWHCRECEGKQIASQQYAGGGGIQGLERGTQKIPGLEIISKLDYCKDCKKKTQWDCWTGETKQANFATNLPEQLIKKILLFYNYIDVIEQRKRPRHELIIDHRFPMERWGEHEKKQDPKMSEEEIKSKFQLLKKDDTGNHNLLKSRACENCIRTGKRGTPFGIRFWYKGDENWPDDIPEKGKEAEQGCVGCGWYNFEKWRETLNQKLEEYYRNNK